jgi:hypothetical protein
MKILVACEYSGRVREAFRKLGHDAWSCDLLPSDDNSPYHIQGDVLEILNDGWDMMIAHPPCTYLANSGVQHMWNGRKKENGKNVERWKNMEDGRRFLLSLLNAPIPKIAVENPLPHSYAELPPYTQIIHPYYFGEEASKRTCLWLKNLPNLEKTNVVSPGERYYDKNGKSNGSKWYQLPPGKDRWKHRSTTFQSIANTMAEQWG